IAVQINQNGVVVDSPTLRGVLVGDVWIAACQSNMQGCGLRRYAAKPHPKVRAFCLDDQWRVARDPIHDFSICVDPVHLDLLGGHTAKLHVVAAASDLDGARLWYGRGPNPYCNVRDEADRALPVFGPVVIGKPRALTDFVRTFDVSDLLPSAGRLENLVYPQRTQWYRRSFPTGFAGRHTEIQQASGDRLVLYRCRLRAAEPMKVAVLLGYDGPVKLWIDGSERFHVLPAPAQRFLTPVRFCSTLLANTSSSSRSAPITGGRGESFCDSSAVMFPRRICESWCPWRCPS
ncbi:MAG: sialate O-acetylesterase, partial [Verrucomicrobiae bacterium]|nr:sialate O-acetylesterase [Verrucomicrobiae bacterium]